MSHRRRRYGYSVAAIVLIVLGLLLAGAQLVLANYRGSIYACIVEGPHSAAADSPWVVTGDVSFWPLGRSCEWGSEASGGTVTTYSGSEPLSLTVAGFLGGGVVLALGMGTIRRSRASNHLSAWAEDEAAS